MTTRITRAHLEAKSDYLNKITSAPVDPYTSTDGKLVANIGHYHISGSYGGYSLHLMATESGGVHDVFSCGHIQARDLAGLISAYTRGIELMKVAA